MADASHPGLRYVNPSFVRRTERIYTYAQSPEEQSALLSQQSLGGAVSLNLSLSRSFRFSGGRWLSVRLTADNLLGTNNIGSGYEQNRIRKVVISQREHVRPFAINVYSVTGKAIRSVDLSANAMARIQIERGVYIVNGQKVVVF